MLDLLDLIVIKTLTFLAIFDVFKDMYVKFDKTHERL